MCCLIQVVEIWHKHLIGIIKVRTKTPLIARGPGPVFDDDMEEEDRLGEASTDLQHCRTRLDMDCLIRAKIAMKVIAIIGFRYRNYVHYTLNRNCR